MTTISPALQVALDRLRAGDAAAARAAAEQALAAVPEDAATLALLGMLLCREGDPAAARPYLRRALDRWPDDIPTRVNLATANAQLGDLDEVERLCAGGPQNNPRLRRLAAFVDQTHGRWAAAETGYEAVVATVPQDFESWNNLGSVRAELGDIEGAITAYRRALELRPDLTEITINLSKQLDRLGARAERQSVLRARAAMTPDDAELQTELGLAETAMRSFAEGEQAYRTALRLKPGLTLAYVELGLLLENLNRVDDLATLIGDLERDSVNEPELDFLRAWLLRRWGHTEDAMRLAERVPASIAPMRRTHLLAELADRLGDGDRAYAAFTEMNAAAVALSELRPEPRSYLDEVRADAERVTPEQVRGWTRIDLPRDPPSPIFIAGFPRSGTTLLDTLLMNMPALHVLEELPIVQQIEDEAGGIAALAGFSSERAAALRTGYFDMLAEIAPPDRPDQIVVDKNPLHMARIPLIQRLFPDARVVLVERHPCDVVLSCFMANFTLNHAMRQFVTLEGAARLYDAAFEVWTRSIAVLPIRWHTIRYERMVEDLEGEMRPLLDFLELPWDPAVLDNQQAAAKRSFITTASYSQVTEPIYRRATGRWQRYRRHLEPVLPILAPWAERMGYDI
jgi:tetratricopeptide (TPR) repeat protein